MRMFLHLFLFLVFLSSQASAADLGVDGEIFPIEEPDLIESIETELGRAAADGRLEEFNNKLTNQAKSAFTAPTPLNLPRATEATSRHYDPTIVVARDIRTHRGILIAAKGTRVNPLEQITWPVPLVFVDGSDPEQMEWVASVKGKIILTGGNPKALMDAHNRQYFFDQKAVLTKRFGITAVPTVITQDGHLLRIDQIVIEGGEQ